MGDWQWYADDTTESYDRIQGRAINLGSFNVRWKIIVTQISGDVNGFGVWGRDALGNDVLLYNGPVQSGSEIEIAEDKNSLQIAVNFTPDNPPHEQRWHFQGRPWRQAYYNAKVDVKLFKASP